MYTYNSIGIMWLDILWNKKMLCFNYYLTFLIPPPYFNTEGSTKPWMLSILYQVVCTTKYVFPSINLCVCLVGCVNCLFEFYLFNLVQRLLWSNRFITPQYTTLLFFITPYTKVLHWYYVIAPTHLYNLIMLDSYWRSFHFYW